MPSCIVCHMNLDEGTDDNAMCNNQHPLHKTCLAEWLLHSQNCPLCSDPYPQDLVDQFNDYKEQKEKEKQAAIDKELEKEREKQAAIDKELEKEEKFIESVEVLLEETKYVEAIDMLFDLYKDNATDEKNLNIMFLLGKANFLKGRYDLTITFLMKLVKIRFDYPDAFLYLGKAYEKLNLHDKAKWAFDRVGTSLSSSGNTALT